MISLASWRLGGTASVTGVIEWKDMGSSGRIGKGDREGVLPSMSKTS